LLSVNVGAVDALGPHFGAHAHRARDTIASSNTVYSPLGAATVSRRHCGASSPTSCKLSHNPPYLISITLASHTSSRSATWYHRRHRDARTRGRHLLHGACARLYYQVMLLPPHTAAAAGRRRNLLRLSAFSTAFLCRARSSYRIKRYTSLLGDAQAVQQLLPRRTPAPRGALIGCHTRRTTSMPRGLPPTRIGLWDLRVAITVPPAFPTTCVLRCGSAYTALRLRHAAAVAYASR